MLIDRVTEFRKELTEYVDALRGRSQKNYLAEFAITRKFNIDTLYDLGIIYIKDMSEMLIPKFLDRLEDFGVISPTNKKPIFSDRYLIPIYDVNGLVQGLVGYSLSSKARYVYATTKYFQRSDIMYNMQCYEKCIEKGYAIVTEGITDAIRLIDMGFECVMATAGAHESLFMMQMLDTGMCTIFVPDRDRAGDGTKEYWITTNYVRLLVPFTYKDIDEYAREEKNRWNVTEFIHMVIDYVLGKNADNVKLLGEELPIYA